MKYRRSLLLLPLLLGLAACSGLKHSPVTDTGQTAETFSLERKQVLTADYLLFLPPGYAASSEKRWPLILFLHGAGERGTNVWLVAKHGPPKEAGQNPGLPFIIVSPQCPTGTIWSDDLVLALLTDVEKKYPVDKHRVYLTGLSMGGFGTWSLGLNHPELFAAIAPVCGGGNFITPLLADKSALTNLPIWAFHGAKDPVVPVEESERMVNYMRKLGVKEVKLTIYPDAQHDCWTQTYANPELFGWFLQHSR
jgi:predicted peptidase